MAGQYTSESGTFYHIGGIVHSFDPHWKNLIREGINARAGIEQAFRTLIVPEGVVGFVDGFLPHTAITDRVIFPTSLISIGTETGASGPGGAFVGCYLPDVELPGSIRCLGFYAFAGCHIKSLTVNPAITSKHCRQFKDSTIETLRLSKAALELFRSSGNDEYRFYGNFYAHCKCNIIEF